MRSDRLHYFRFLRCNRPAYADIVRPKGEKKRVYGGDDEDDWKMQCDTTDRTPQTPFTHLPLRPFPYSFTFLSTLPHSFTYLIPLSTNPTYSFLLLFISTTILPKQDDNQLYNQLIHTQIKAKREASFYISPFVKKITSLPSSLIK